MKEKNKTIELVEEATSIDRIKETLILSHFEEVDQEYLDFVLLQYHNKVKSLIDELIETNKQIEINCRVNSNINPYINND